MLKRIIGLLISVLSVIALGYWYIIIAKVGPEKAISTSVPLLISVEAAGQLQDTLFLPQVADLLPATGLRAKSALMAWINLLAPDTLWRKQAAVLGWQISGGQASSLLVIDAGRSEKALMRAIETYTSQQANFKTHPIYSLHRDSMADIAVGKFYNLLIFANLPLLVEEALAELDHPDPESRQWFAQAKSKDKAQGQLYVRPVFLAQLYKEALSAEGLGQIQNWRQLFENLRIDFRPEGTWSGQLIPNQQQAFLRAVSGQGKLQSEALLATLPANALFSFHFPINKVRSFVAPFGAAFANFTKDWVGEEAAISLMSPINGDPTSGAALFFAVRDEAALHEAITKLEDRVGALATSDYGMFQIHQILDQELLQSMLPAQQGNLSLVVLDKTLVLASSPKTLERLLDQILVGNTLANDSGFKALAQENTGAARLYLHADKFQYLLSSWLEDERIIDGVEQLGMGCFDLDFSTDVLDFQGRWKPADPTTNGSAAEVLWRTRLEAPVASQPYYVPALKLLLLQDSSQNLHALDRNGRLLWSRKLDSQLQSEVLSVDYYADGNRQLIFNTAWQVYLVDARGKDIRGFPLTLQTAALNSLSLVDFDANGGYSIFLAGANGQFYGFDKKGGALVGWNPHPMVFDRPIYPLTHVQYDNQDYLVVLDQGGQLAIFGKNGQERFPPMTLGQTAGSPPYSQLNTERQIAGINRIVAADDHGQVLVVNPEGQTFRLALEVGKNQDVQFVFADFVGDERKDYLACSGASLALYYYNEQGFIRQFQVELPQPADRCFPIHLPGATQTLIGAFNHQSGQIYLLDAKGEMREGFPLAGTTAFTLMDSAGGGVLVVGNGTEVYAYRVE